MGVAAAAGGAVGVGAACVIIGVIIGTVSLTGLGLTFGYEILKFVGKDQMYLGGLFVMIMSTILGMGVPGVAAYVIVAAVAVRLLLDVTGGFSWLNAPIIDETYLFRHFYYFDPRSVPALPGI